MHEFNIERAIELTEALGLPFYCTQKQWDTFENKGGFKRLCETFGIDVARQYDPDSTFGSDVFPLAVKPLDGSGSRGFSRVDKLGDLQRAVENARRFSPTGAALVEDYIDGDAVIIHYTVSDGKVLFSGIADKHSERVGSDGAPIMAVQLAPSVHQDEYLASTDEKARLMIESTGLTNAPLWIEAFYSNGRFIFNEAGLRFGGSMTNVMVEKLAGIDQMSVLYGAVMGDRIQGTNRAERSQVYAIMPVHVRPGVISSIDGLDHVKDDDNFVSITMVHHVGDAIEPWGSAQQVLAYLHFAASDIASLLDSMRYALGSLSVRDEETGKDLLFSLFDPREPDAYPSFLRKRLNESE